MMAQVMWLSMVLLRESAHTDLADFVENLSALRQLFGYCFKCHNFRVLWLLHSLLLESVNG